MKWKKVGLIFNPTLHKLPNDCREFAQSPQALVFDDFIRIYFSTRQRDLSNNKYYSHIAFADFDCELKNILQISSGTVIELGELGCFDEHGIFPINPLRVGDKIVAYTCGWSRRISVSVETSVGYAFSENNGLTFTKLGNGPILTSSLQEPMLVGDAFVKQIDGRFHMWYIFGIGWRPSNKAEPSARIYKIGHAVSADGINWKKNDGKQIISDRLGTDECQALPSVLKIGSRYHMFFCYRESTDFRVNANRGYRLGYAYSDDLENWTRDDEKSGIELSASGWDSEMMCYPHIFECGEKVFLLYNGNEFGRNGFGAAELAGI